MLTSAEAILITGGQVEGLVCGRWCGQRLFSWGLDCDEGIVILWGAYDIPNYLIAAGSGGLDRHVMRVEVSVLLWY